VQNLQAVARRMTAEAGFKELKVLDWQSMLNSYYMVTP
jgi:hypothetical protein